MEQTNMSIKICNLFELFL